MKAGVYKSLYSGYVAVYPNGTRVKLLLPFDPVLTYIDYGWNIEKCMENWRRYS